MSMHVNTNCTPSDFMRATCADRSVTPKLRLLSSNTILATGYFLNDALIPARQSADCAAVYARTPTFVAPSCFTNDGSPGRAHVKHNALSFGKKFVGPIHSLLMFQPN